MKLKSYFIVSTVIIGISQWFYSITTIAADFSKTKMNETAKNVRFIEENKNSENCDWLVDFDINIRTVSIAKATTQPNREVLGTKT